MSGSGGDVKSVLRKLEFPYSAKDALERAEHFCINAEATIERCPKNLHLVQELIAEFVFCEVDDHGNKKDPMRPIPELSLTEVLCDHFSKASGGNVKVDAARTTLFLILFNPLDERRIKVLAKLVSLAISTKRVAVLSTTGVWMQCTLPTSPVATVNLANMLVQDFFILYPTASTNFKDLPQLTPLFTANLLTAFTAIYGLLPTGKFLAPPISLLEVITQWICDNPQLCLTPLLPVNTGSIVTNPITPVVGLFRWCVLFPLFHHSQDQRVSSLYSCLHLSLLQCLLSTESTHKVTATKAEEFIGLINDVAVKVKGNTGEKLALDRLVQAIQIAIDSSHLANNPHLLLTKLSVLPQTKLLQIVLQKHSAK